MRQLMLILFVLLWATPGLAALTLAVPFTVVPGSVTFQPYDGSASVPGPSSFPISEFVVADTSGACIAGSVTFTAEIVDDGFEVEIDGFEAGGCTLGGRVEFDMDILVPELNATNTVARLVPEILVFDFIDFTEVESKFRVDSAFTSSNPDIRFRYAGNGGIVKWDGSQEDPILSLLDPQHWIPGDTLRLHVSIFHTMRGTNTVAAQGKVKVRYEHRITLPAPSASLSLPLGAAWLAGLSMMKGGA